MGLLRRSSPGKADYDLEVWFFLADAAAREAVAAWELSKVISAAGARQTGGMGLGGADGLPRQQSVLFRGKPDQAVAVMNEWVEFLEVTPGVDVQRVRLRGTDGTFVNEGESEYEFWDHPDSLALERELFRSEPQRCPACGRAMSRSFMQCPGCGANLQVQLGPGLFVSDQEEYFRLAGSIVSGEGRASLSEPLMRVTARTFHPLIPWLDNQPDGAIETTPLASAYGRVFGELRMSRPSWNFGGGPGVTVRH